MLEMSKVKFPNKRMTGVQMSGGIREILAKAEELEAGGKSIIHMEIGRPDFDSPECAKEAVVRSIRAGNVHYTDMSGSYELRKAVAEKYGRENNMKICPDKNVVITCGAMEAITASFLTLLDPGDEVIVPKPYFPPYADQLSIVGAEMKAVETSPEKGFSLTAEALETAVTPKTKALLINNPNNPSGAVLLKKNLEEIAAFAKKHDIWVISDECYEKFLYGGEFVSIGSLPGMTERTVTISAASKTWSMTGWRIGWLICPEEMRPYANKCHQNLTTCATSFAQAGVTEAFSCAADDVTKMIAEYKRRRDLVMDWMKKIKGFKCTEPSGAFYAFPDISALKMDGFKFCSWLLEEAGVSTVPGEVFGMPGHIRIAYCNSYENVNEGMARIQKAVENL
jgi:aspartate/methionine/tyrosine aminotransferase